MAVSFATELGDGLQFAHSHDPKKSWLALPHGDGWEDDLPTSLGAIG